MSKALPSFTLRPIPATLAAMLFCISSPAFAQGPPAPVGGPIPNMPVPAGNPITLAKTQLGKALFWDEQLSSTRTTACATCHIPSAGGSDPRSALSQTIHPGFDGLFGTSDDVVGSPGQVLSQSDGTYTESPEFGLEVQVTPRKTPTVINAAFAPRLFWDGRATGHFDDPVTGNSVLLFAAALESQVAGPPVNDTEMGHLGRDWNDVAARVAASKPLALATNLDADLVTFIGNSSYTDLFSSTFGSPGVTPARIAMAIATYERTLISDQTPLDAGPGALTPQEVQGRQIFNTTGRCNACHSGPFLTDFAFKNTGVTPIFEDLGLGGSTGVAGQNGRFKTPDLRNIELRAPYFHDGSAKTLEEVVDFYDRGGDFHIGQAPAVAPIGLTTAQKAALVAFLKRPLTDPRVLNETGPFSRPTLYSESNQLPASYGFGSAAASGIVPRAIALEPQLVGNPSMTVAVNDAEPFGSGFLVIDFAQGFSTLLGADVLVGLTSAVSLIPAGPMQGSGPGGGYNSLSLSIPNDPNLIGVPVYMQWFVLAGSLSATEGVKVIPF